MNKIINTLYNKYSKIKILISIFCVLVYLVFIHLAGASVFEYIGYILAVSFLILIPGYSIYRLLKLEKYLKEIALPVSFLIGVLVLLACFIIDINLKLNHFIVVPIIILSVLYLQNITKKEGFRLEIIDNQKIFLFLVISALLFVVGIGVASKNAHPIVSGQNFLSQDLMWHVGNAQSFLLGFPVRDLRVDGVLLYYHYLNEMLSAGISYFSGISVFNIMAFYNQSFILFILVNSLYSLGVVFYKNNKLKANIFMLSIFFFTCLSLHKVLLDGASEFSVSLIPALLTNVNATSLAFCFLAIFISVFYIVSKYEYKIDLSVLIVLFISFLFLTFSKSPIAAIIVIALVVSLMARFLQLNFKVRELVLTIVISLVFLVLYEQYFSYGAEVSGTFDFTKTLSFGYFGRFIPANFSSEVFKITHFILILGLMGISAICISPFTVSIFIYSCFKKIFKFKILDFFTLSCYAVSIGGFLAFFITAHQAFSQVYFLYIALFFINLIAIKEFDFSKKSFINYSLYLVLSISFITTMFLYINIIGSGLRQMLFHYDIIEKYEYKTIIKSEDELAGIFLNENLEENELFLTNRITDYSPELSNVYTCFSGRQTYLEGYKYTVSNMGLSKDFPDVYLMHENVDMVFNLDTDIKIIIDFCKENKIKYIVFSKQATGENSHLEDLEIVFNKDTVVIYKVY